MSLIAHLRELRNRIALALLFIGIATAFCFWWYDHGLGVFIRAPYCSIPADNRALGTGSASGDCALLGTHVFGGALIRPKIAFIAGVAPSPPVRLVQPGRGCSPPAEPPQRRQRPGLCSAPPQRRA